MPLWKLQFNRVIIGLSIWLVIGLILRHFLKEDEPTHHQDVEMAQVFVKDNPELKATWKLLDDGRIRIKPRKGKPFYLKDGVIMYWK
jgi:hypothetical protein